MVSSAEKRFLAAAALGKSIEKGVFKRAAIIERKIGALQKRHARTARFYTLKHSAGRLEITRDDEKMKSVLAQCGDSVLNADMGLGAAQLWELSMTLLKAEAASANSKARSDCDRISIHSKTASTVARSTSASQAKPTTNKNASRNCSASTGNPSSQPRKPKSQRKEIGVPLGRAPRFYAGLWSAVRNLG